MSEEETKQNDIQKYDKIEKLRKDRTNLRRLFTTICKQFEKKHEEKAEGKELGAIFHKLADKAERLFKADDQLMEFVVLSDKEYDEMETYRDRFIELKTEYEHYLLQGNRDATPTDTAPIGKLKLPKIELKEYDLMPRTWVAFWAQYSRIHEDASIREEDKFQYLLSSLKPISKARSIVESYPPSKKNYLKVIEHLESRFGRRDLLIDVFIRDLLTLVNNRANIKLSDLYDKLGSSLRALETLGVTTQNYAAMLYPVVESCLPTDVLKAWDRYSLSTEVGNEDTVQLTKEKLLEKLMSFIRREVEGEEHRALAERAFGQNAKSKRESSSKDEPTAIALTSSEKSSKIKCIFCQKCHASQECHKAASMNTEERKSVVIRRRCCLVCLKSGHLAKNCRSSIHCLICGRRHYVILCPELPKENKVQLPNESKMELNTSTLFTELKPQKVIYLKTLLLRLRNGNQKRYVRALLDDGSQRSYVTKNVVQELRLNPSGTEMLSQGLFGGKQTSEVRHGRYDIKVESIDRRFSYNLSVLDQSKICCSLPRIRDADLIQELKVRGIELTDVGPETPPIEMLIGADFLGGILTGRIEVFPSGITAIETKLGWSVLGPGKRKCLNMVSLSLHHSEIHKICDLESLGITDPTERKATKELDEETSTSVQLISAKARIAPMKRPTIPRLELLGAAMGVRLACTVLEAIRRPLRIFFGVLMVVLSWITKGEPWNTFVGNRVKEIRKLTDIDSWRFIPADQPSRACGWKDLIDSRWWEGPLWLKEEESNWPNTEITMPEEALVERKKSVCNASINLPENFSKELLYFSKYSKVIRMVAWMLRFANIANNKFEHVTSELTSDEIQKAEETISKLIQREGSHEDKEIQEKSATLSLNVLKSDFSVLHMLHGTVDGGREWLEALKSYYEESLE